MNVEQTKLAGVLRLTPRRFGDERGQFWESWNATRYAEAGITLPFVQDNVSRSVRGVLRGLHAQNPTAQGKLVGVLQGAVFDVVVDLRRGSTTFGQWIGETLTAENGAQLWMPPGFAHGFMALEDNTLFTYKCTATYAPQHEFTVMWNDPDIGIEWPNGDKIVSDKDQRGFAFASLDSKYLDF
jgi:dTDP-4-dehydrorhamnose 3,5-epimerase